MMKIQTILPALLGLALAAFAGSSSAAQAPDAGIVFAAGLDRKAEIYVLERAGTKRRLTRNRAYDRARSRLVNQFRRSPVWRTHGDDGRLRFREERGSPAK